MRRWAVSDAELVVVLRACTADTLKFQARHS
jgi:hypothetical protein